MSDLTVDHKFFLASQKFQSSRCSYPCIKEKMPCQGAGERHPPSPLMRWRRQVMQFYCNSTFSYKYIVVLSSLHFLKNNWKRELKGYWKHQHLKIISNAYKVRKHVSIWLLYKENHLHDTPVASLMTRPVWIFFSKWHSFHDGINEWIIKKR